jgi:hypothetical protein
MVGSLCLYVIAAAGAASGASEPPSSDPAPLSPERLQKLIGQLGDSKFKVREQAAQELSRLGRLALPALKEAAADNKDVEIRKRAKALAEAIQARDRPRAGLLSLLSRLQQAQPAPSDRQVAVAIYLLSVSRPATDAELNAAEKRLKKEASDKGKRRVAEELMWPLLTGREFNDKLADFNLRVMDLKGKITGTTLAETLHRLNTEEFQKSLVDLTGRLKAALEKRSDAQVVDAIFLVLLARFPHADQTTTALAYIKKIGKREQALSDLLWSLMNTKEFFLSLGK